MALETFMDPEVMKFVANVGSEEALAEEMKTATRRGAGGRIGVWCVLQRETGEKLGTAILLPLPIDENRTPHLPEGRNMSMLGRGVRALRTLSMHTKPSKYAGCVGFALPISAVSPFAVV
jgi:hypothetical protein